MMYVGVIKDGVAVLLFASSILKLQLVSSPAWNGFTTAFDYWYTLVLCVGEFAFAIMIAARFSPRLVDYACLGLFFARAPRTLQTVLTGGW
ncbi:MAG: hypothetical protein Aurels2KO_50770 [Aureliella sp.]